MAIKSITIRPGECVVLPKDALVQAIVTTGSISVTSSCASSTLPAPSSYKCGYFFVRVDNDSNDSSPMDEDSTLIESVKVGDTTYLLNEKIIATGDNPGTVTTIGTLNLHMTDSAIFQFMAIRKTDLSKSQAIYLYFQTPEALYSTLEMKLTDRGNASYYKPIDSTCGEYPDPA